MSATPRRPRRPRRSAKLALGLAAALLVGLGAWFLARGPARRFSAPTEPVTAISHAGYHALLRKYVGADGKVDYARWKEDAADVQALDAYLATLTNATPDTRPELFASQPERLGFWINLYNALVVREIVRRWPLASVTDVRVNATSGLVTGKGFFHDLTFRVGGRDTNLRDLENEILRARFEDARVHFAINCGSASCPLLARNAFEPAALEAQLEEATRTFVNDGTSVAVDAGGKRIVLSKIFDWYADDFRAFARARAGPPDADVVDFVLLYAAPPLGAALREAKARRYALSFLDYDWRVNAGRGPDAGASTRGVGAPFPDVAFPRLGDGGVVAPGALRGKVVLVDFWATHCKPCRASFPRLQALAERHRSAGLIVLGIAEDDEPRKVVTDFLAETGATFDIAIDPEHVAAGPELAVRSLPTEMLVDRDGIVRYRHEGADDDARTDLDDAIEAALRPGRSAR